MCAGVMTRPDTAFMGFYAVDPKYQGMGIGRELWAKTTARLGGYTTNTGLYGVPAMTEKYEKSGFKVEDSIRMLIYESDVNSGPLNDSEQLSQLTDLSELKIGDLRSKYRLELIDGNTSEEIFNKLIEYDTRINSFSRDKLLRNYLWSSSHEVPLTFAIVRDTPNANQQHSHQAIQGQNFGERKSSCCAKPCQESIIEDETLSTKLRSSLSISATNVADTDQYLRSSSPVDIPSVGAASGGQCKQVASSGFEIVGYGCIRHDNTSGGMIGPIYADSSDICQVLLKNLLKHFKLPTGGKYSVMALSSNQEACRLLESIGLFEMDQCSRMFTRFVPTASYSKIFYVHSPNFTLF